MIVYVCQDGAHPSGVATYGYALLRHVADARMLLLNCDEVPTAVPGILTARVVTMPTSFSHDPMAVARSLMKLVENVSSPVTLVPNTGDTPWAGVAEFLRRASPALRERVRVLGIVHSDMETQFALAEQYQAIAPVWCGVSRRCVDELRRRFGGRGLAVHQLFLPVGVQPAQRHREDGPLRLAYVGRLDEPQKRVSRLVELFSALARRGVDFVATVVGDGPAAADLSESLLRAGSAVNERVRMTGSLGREAINEVWRTHDVALLVSAFEGLPIAILEAMAGGVPPVAMWIQSGLEDLLTDGVEGRVVPQGDVGAMADVLAALAADRAAVIRMGCAARRRVQEQFSPEAHFARLDKIIAELWLHSAPDVVTLAPDPTAAAVLELTARAAKEKSPVAVYGAGMFGRKVIDAFLREGVQVVALFDSDPERTGTSYRGLECQPATGVSEVPSALFVAASLQFAPAMAARIEAEFASAGRQRPTIIQPQP